jgi:formamidopyrimidine-DNA glycosylase
MPELPEVEVTRLGVAPLLQGRAVTGVAARTAALRYPLPAGLGETLAQRVLRQVERRGKYLLFCFDHGRLLIHLGMSGSLRVLPAPEAPRKHDHLDLAFGRRLLRLHDPRRFGAALWLPEGEPEHPLLTVLGVEPLSEAFDADWLHATTRGRRAAIKPTLMDSHLVVGVGNIYASESLFRAGIDPRAAAGRSSLARDRRLVPAIKDVLAAAIAQGGSTLRDFVGSDGAAGYFQQEHLVYGREGQACRVCGGPIRQLRQGQRSTFFCPRCQH